MNSAFVLEILIPAADIEIDEQMMIYRSSLDAGARRRHAAAHCTGEELTPFIRYAIAPTGEKTALPETDDSRAWRILRRFYR